MAEDPRKTELTAQLARARTRITADLGALRRDLDFPARARHAVMRHPAAWVGGATLLGVLLSRLAARKKTVAVRGRGTEAKIAKAGQAGLLLGALKIAFDLSRPVITKWASRRVADYLDGTKKSAPLPR